jgi:hypothetical protein
MSDIPQDNSVSIEEDLESPEVINPYEQVAHKFDVTSKEIIRGSVEKWFKMIGIPLPEDGNYRISECNVELTKTIVIRPDLVFRIEYPNRDDIIVHIEAERETQKHNIFRVVEYNGHLESNNAKRNEKGSIMSLPDVRSHIVYILPNSGKSDPGEFMRKNEKGEIIKYLKYENIYLYEKTLEEVIDIEFWDLLAYAPCFKEVKPEMIPRVQELISRHTKDPEKLERLLFSLAFYFKRLYDEDIRTVIPNYNPMAAEEAIKIGKYGEIMKEKEREEIAINALMEGVPLNTIAKITHLSIQVIQSLQAKLNSNSENMAT